MAMCSATMLNSRREFRWVFQDGVDLKSLGCRCPSLVRPCMVIDDRVVSIMIATIVVVVVLLPLLAFSLASLSQGSSGVVR